MTTSTSRGDVSIQLSSKSWEENEFEDALTVISVDVFLNKTEKVGYISAVAINRSRIPSGYFLVTMDEYSAELQEAAVTFFESKLGRYRIQSMARVDQDYGSAVLFIEKMHIDKDFKGPHDSEIGTLAIQKMLAHPSLQGRDARVQSAIYVPSRRIRRNYESW